MDFIDKHDGALRMQSALRCFGFFDRFTNVLHPPQHRAHADELGVKRIGHEPRDRGFTNAWRPPQNAAVGLPRLKGQAQGHALTQNVLLTNHLPQCAGTQPFSQGHVCGHVLAQGRMTSTPTGGRNTKVSAARAGLISKPLRVSTERWPRLSCTSMTTSSTPLSVLRKPADRD